MTLKKYHLITQAFMSNKFVNFTEIDYFKNYVYYDFWSVDYKTFSIDDN